MPWKLLLSLAGISILLVFAGYNLDHRSEISFGFMVLKDVPIFFSLAVSFFLGGFTFLLVSLVKRKGKTKFDDEDSTPVL